MGCCSSSSSPPVTAQRKRLSIGDIGPLPAEDINYGGIDDDRSFMLQLNQRAVFDLVKAGDVSATPSRRISVSTITDDKMHKVPSFKKKTVQSYGERLNAAQDGIGYACMKGKKPESPNQDSFFIMKVEHDFSVYGVFDGHGHKGHDISNFIKDNLPKLLLQHEKLQEDPLEALTASFAKMQQLIVQATKLKLIDAVQSGSTVSVIYHDHRKQVLHVAHVGDSRCVLGRSDPAATGDAQWVNVDLTVDHKPDMPEERARIEAAGGRVVYDGGWNHRVYAKNHRGPGLNMSRAMGDLVGFFHAGISAVPDVHSQPVTDGTTSEPTSEPAPVQREGSEASQPSRVSGSTPSVKSYKINAADRFLLLCSDGVWEFVSSAEAVKFVGRFSPGEAKEAAESLAQVSWDRWIEKLEGQVVDDITAIVVNLTPTPPT